MLYPQMNRCRTIIDLCGFWEIKIEEEKNGIDENWHQGFEADAIIGIPGSWNEQLSELGLMDYKGKIWYQCTFFIPASSEDNCCLLHFGSADFFAEVWLNGNSLGKHSGGYLPFEFDLKGKIREGEENLLIVSIDNILTYETIPQGIRAEDFNTFNKLREQNYPITVFDFLNYGGINRPVKLIVQNTCHLESIITDTNISGNKGILNFEGIYNKEIDDGKVKVKLYDEGDEIIEKIFDLSTVNVKGNIEIENCYFWSPDSPHLYELKFELFSKGVMLDEYKLDIGIREVRLSENDLLLNGNPIFLKGFGKHEDFPVLGKGISHPLIVKDFQLMKWIGANSFRTSHYPYSEEIMQMADRMGFIVIDEVPAVSLNFHFVNDKTLNNHKQALTELINRDRNHACVISWSIGNEPGIWGEKEANSEMADSYWSEIYDHVKHLDNTRPITLPACSTWGEDDLSYKYSDFLSVNRYWGWYEIPGKIKEAGDYLKNELQNLFDKYKKPIMITEFGAESIEGEHETYPQMFSEEYQDMLIMQYFHIIESLPFTIGEHVWNFADFRTAQHHRRVILNRKGVFNRVRQPKCSAFSIKKHWQNKTNK